MTYNKKSEHLFTRVSHRLVVRMRRSLESILFCYCLCFASTLQCIRSNFANFIDENPIVETDLGKVQGKVLQSRLGNHFYAFRGIRYARPPVGVLRFKVSIFFQRIYKIESISLLGSATCRRLEWNVRRNCRWSDVPTGNVRNRKWQCDVRRLFTIEHLFSCIATDCSKTGSRVHSSGRLLLGVRSKLQFCRPAKSNGSKYRIGDDELSLGNFGISEHRHSRRAWQ